MTSDLELTASNSKPIRLSQEEEVDLARQVAEGNESAWEKLQSAFYLSIAGFFAGSVGKLDDAESLANVAMWRAYLLVRENKYNSQYRFYTFLRMVSKGILSEYRKAQSRSNVVQPFSNFLSYVAPDSVDESYEDFLNAIIEPKM